MPGTNFLNFIKDKFTKAAFIAITLFLLVSISLNVYFILGGGLKIDKSINTLNLQGQSQSTVVINGTPYSSDQIQWIQLSTTVDNAGKTLESLTNFQTWNAKIIKKSILGDDIIIFYPELKEKKKLNANAVTK